MYHANLFPLVRHEPLPIYRYQPRIDPQPTNKPQLYQVLNTLAKQTIYEEKTPVVSIQGNLVSLGSPIKRLDKHVVEIPEVEKFSLQLEEIGKSTVATDHFDEYKLLVNRLADIALTIFSNEYYKFHPDAPYILRDEPYFDKGLIETTGIIDSKKYYRGLHQFGEKLVFILNRETELRSYRNLLTEMQSLRNRFETVNDTKVDFYAPTSEFVRYINSLVIGKAADVLKYPGPRVPRIKEVTWKYRAKDTTPGSKNSPIEYLHDVYGLTSLDPLQPLIVYDVIPGGRTQYHLPEVLSVGHDFRDLEKRIPSWQRTQVWGTIHPDCKNQLQKIYGVLLEIDENLRKQLPQIYPGLLEISRNALDVTSIVSQRAQIDLQFGNKVVSLKSPYDLDFYARYSGKKVAFARPVGDAKVLVCVEDRSRKIDDFLKALADEFELRNNSHLIFEFDELDLKRTDYSNYNLVLVIEKSTNRDDDTYGQCKKIIQNEHGVIHQHITQEHADKDSVMALVMELSLKLGGEPWLLPEEQCSPIVVGIHSYRNPDSEEQMIFAIALDGRGALLKHFEPVTPDKFGEVARSLALLNQERRRVLYLFSFDKFAILGNLTDALSQVDDIEYCIVEVTDQDYLRFFETWTPKRAPRFGKATEIVRSPIEAEEKAPQGVSLQFDQDTFFVLTGRTIEKGELKRGCPAPIRLSVRKRKGDGWKPSDLVDYMFKLCMMGRSSGHMTSFPSPIYYLKLYAHYFHDFGIPKDEGIRQRIFYV